MALVMDLSAWQSGLATAWADAKEFLAAVRFARPWALWLTLLPVAVGIIGWVAGRLARRRLTALGRPGAVAGLVTDRRRTGGLTRLAVALAWSALVLGVAGPRWGKGDDGGVAVGRDVMIVLDFSRSMLATDLTDTRPRWKAAVDAVHAILDAARASGGHRIGLVVFAARPTLIVPLTTDYEHVAVRLSDLSGDLPPNDVRPLDDTAKSGTRIGAALTLAVEAHDLRYPGAQDILLFSDGDDPVNDREWSLGVSAALRKQIPVHVVGIGDPARPSPVTLKGVQLIAADRLVESQLHEEVLTAVATEGRGRYIPARRESPSVSDFLARLPDHPREWTDDAVPQPKDRSVWFFAAAFVFLLCWLWRARP